MTEYRDAAVHFEGVKLKMTQDKNGYVLTLSIHPAEVPDSVLRAWVGTRYTVAMVELDEREKPVLTEEQQEGAKAVQMAGILCHDREFQRFLSKETGNAIFGQEECADALRSILGITSRKELKDDADARAALTRITDEYGMWREIG